MVGQIFNSLSRASRIIFLISFGCVAIEATNLAFRDTPLPKFAHFAWLSIAATWMVAAMIVESHVNFLREWIDELLAARRAPPEDTSLDA